MRIWRKRISLETAGLGSESTFPSPEARMPAFPLKPKEKDFSEIIRKFDTYSLKQGGCIELGLKVKVKERRSLGW